MNVCQVPFSNHEALTWTPSTSICLPVCAQENDVTRHYWAISFFPLNGEGLPSPMIMPL